MKDNLSSPAKPFSTMNLNKIFIGVLVASILLGVTTGVLMAKSSSSSKLSSAGTNTTEKAKTAKQDRSTFKDFAEGTVQKRAEPKNADEYVEGTHLLIREGALPVAMTSSVEDLTLYEGKKVKVYGQTQKALKEGWLMDVGLVEEK
jgi:hypothetical protein